MRQSLLKKSLTILTIFLLASCSQPQVACHGWTQQEKSQLKSEDKALPADATMHGLIKDYERVCAQLS